MSATVRHWRRSYKCDHKGVHKVHAADEALKCATGKFTLSEALELNIALEAAKRYKLGEHVYLLVEED
jgi:hypothetical protein